jgi:hypothetical protein
VGGAILSWAERWALEKARESKIKVPELDPWGLLDPSKEHGMAGLFIVLAGAELAAARCLQGGQARKEEGRRRQDFAWLGSIMQFAFC